MQHLIGLVTRAPGVENFRKAVVKADRGETAQIVREALR